MRNLLLIFLFCFAANSYATPDKENAALNAANEWLKLVDTGKYKESYREAASFFKSKVTGPQWEKLVKEARDPLGKLLNRKLKVKQYTTSLPEAPEGQYVVIQFNSTFEKKRGAVETITPMLDKDKKWRVSGYYIK